MRYLNRELSWVEFNDRVLSEACKESVPLLERLSFLSIVSSNFDEFFQVRVASIKRRISEAPSDEDSLLMERISKRCHEIVNHQYRVLNGEVLPLLSANGFSYVEADRFSPAERDYAQDFFKNQVYPLLTPLRTDGPEFPHIVNQSPYAVFMLEKISGLHSKETVFSARKDSPRIVGLVQIPQSIPRIVWLPDESGSFAADSQIQSSQGMRFTLLDDIITAYGDMLFPGYSLTETLLLKVDRDADFSVDEEAGSRFIQAMEEVLVKRQTSFAVRMVCNSTSSSLKKIVQDKLNLSESDVYRVEGIIDVTALSHIAGMGSSKSSFASNLRYPQWENFYPADLPEDETFWNTIRQHDVLLNVPYQSFEPVVKFVQDAARDKNVLAIKMTLYRLGSNSPIVRALEKAAQNGKHVTAFVEVKARFDEQQNISWVNELVDAGVTVVYGVVNIKVHAKLCLVIRRESDGLRRYLHMSTGNYNPATAKVYQDLSVFTCNPQLTTDATFFLNVISGYSTVQSMPHLYMAPVTLKGRLLSLIDREIMQSTPETPGLIMAKMNSLCHKEIIDALYRASQAGVRVMLNVRGICTLVPGVPGLSENISVVSIIDRYLEHSRVCYFQNGGEEELYIGSADWMDRNLDRRVELMFPVTDSSVFESVKEILSVYFEDNCQSYRLQSDGTWKAITAEPGEPVVRAQEILYQHYKKADDAKKSAPRNDFVVRRVD